MSINFNCSKLPPERIEIVVHAEGAIAADRHRPVPKQEKQIETIIRVNRSARSIYPEWMRKLIHPELEGTGPSEYNLATVEQCFFECQKNGRVEVGDHIYEHLATHDMLKTCLTLRDGEEIIERGIDAFHKYFGNKSLFLWKSVVLHHCGYFFVPYLCGRGTSVAVHWNWLKYDWDDRHPGATFAN